MNRRRSAFTLIEILVVIGVILILISLSVVGYQVVERSAAANQTKTTLDNLNAMLSEFDAAAGSTALPTYNNGAAIGATGVTNLEVGDVSSQGGSRYGPIEQATATAMAAFVRNPNNAKAIAQLPATKVLRDTNNNTIPTNSMVGPVLLDGWDNPIIYVPAGGIYVDITTGGTATQVVLIQSRDSRPFFASAGPDGDFGAVNGTTASPPPQPTAGDDNVYSRAQ